MEIEAWLIPDNITIEPHHTRSGVERKRMSLKLGVPSQVPDWLETTSAYMNMLGIPEGWCVWCT